MAGPTSPPDVPFHAHLRQLAQRRRGLLRHPHPASSQARRFQGRRRSTGRHQPLRRRPQCSQRPSSGPPISTKSSPPPHAGTRCWSQSANVGQGGAAVRAECPLSGKRPTGKFDPKPTSELHLLSAPTRQRPPTCSGPVGLRSGRLNTGPRRMALPVGWHRRHSWGKGRPRGTLGDGWPHQIRRLSPSRAVVLFRPIPASPRWVGPVRHQGH
jgi:hypothetical protein